MFQLTWNTSMSTTDPNTVLQAPYKSLKLKALHAQVMCYMNSGKEQLLTLEFKVLCDYEFCQCLLQPLTVEIFLFVLLSLCSAEIKTHSDLEIAQHKRKNNSCLQNVLEAVQTWRSGILKIPQDLGNSQFQQLAPLWTF